MRFRKDAKLDRSQVEDLRGGGRRMGGGPVALGGGGIVTLISTRFFEGSVSTACGNASSAVGPFYCPADCYAGAWVANAVRTGLIEEITRKDIQDALSAAAAIGDDRIQERVEGRVTPENWTHGSSEQRQSWFARGREGGNPRSCDTFSGRV